MVDVKVLNFKIGHTTKLVRTKYIRIVFEGSGDPGDNHDIVGVHFLDESKRRLEVVGEESFDRSDVYESTT